MSGTRPTSGSFGPSRHRARLQVLLAVLAATGFIFPFRLAAADGHGMGAALGLLIGVTFLLGPLAAFRFGRASPHVRQRSTRLAWRLAVAAALGNAAQGFAFEALHPGVATVLLQTNFLFVAVFGALWLRETLSPSLAVGLLLVAGGIVLARAAEVAEVVAMSENEGAVSWPLLLGVFWALGAAASFSAMDLLSRRDGADTDSLVVNAQRSAGAVLLLSLVPGATDDLLSLGWERWLACLGAAALGPGLARNLLLTAAKELPAVESALLQQIRPVVALPLTSVVFGLWPSGFEWSGSMLILLGVVLPLWVSRRQRRS